MFCISRGEVIFFSYMNLILHQPPLNCSICPRLAEFRAQNRLKFPNYYNDPVPAFGSINSTHLIVGLAPGLHGANQTGRPFTNDYAGDVLYPALLKYGLASGNYGKCADDGLQLHNVRITNAVRCVPPENKPIGTEIASCNQFLCAEIAAMPNLERILVLGAIAHKATLKALRFKQSSHPFKHGAIYDIAGIKFFCSYHTSRYNLSTKVLTTAMFDKVIANFAA
jgi:uracil-DNA glycosylase